MGKTNNIAFDILLILCIAFDRQKEYNIAILGEGAFIAGAPRKGEMTMPASKAQQKAVSKYMKENYDVFQIRMPKGKKAEIQSAASAVGESLNAYINASITQRMERDTSRSPAKAPTALSGGGAVSLPSGAIKAAQEATEAEETVPVSIARVMEAQAQRDKMGRKMKGGKTNE